MKEKSERGGEQREEKGLSALRLNRLFCPTPKIQRILTEADRN